MKIPNEEKVLFYKHTCLMCNKHFSRLKDHLIRMHEGMTFDEYCILYPEFKQAMLDADTIRRAKLSAAGKGRIVSEETRKKVSDASKKMHERHKAEDPEGYFERQRRTAKNARDSKGDDFKHSEETKKKMSGPRFSMRGRKLTQEHKDNISAARSGISTGPHSDATKAAIREGLARFKESDRYPEYIENQRKIGSSPENIARLKEMNHLNQLKRADEGYISSLESEFIKYLESEGLAFSHQFQVFDRELSWTYDFYIPSLNLIVETDGEYWHRTPEQINRDKIKTDIAIRNSYNFLRISDSNKDWDSIYLGNDLQLSKSKALIEIREMSLADVPIT